MSAPTQIAHYTISGKLGEGGMGEVYRATDSKLNRDVAIKVLPPALARDADYLARFQREAQTLAALNHPNIASIYGLEGNAIVMELVEGQTLRGPMPLPEALAAARQIAEALEAAHEKGIIHRDLKPGNVKVTPEGVVKVLDFGLAKAVERGSTATGADSPTLTMGATEAGLILGTAGYMSPEQAAGKPVDRRADIWSFGVVVWELITGQRLFDGETVSHTLAHVLTGAINLDALPAGPVRDLVGRCLDRNLKTRLRDIGEARIAIDAIGRAPLTEKTAAPRGSYLPWAIAGASLLVAAALGLAWLGKQAPVASPVTLELTPPEGTTGIATGFSLSPDGRTLAFVGRSAKGGSLLWLRPLDSLAARAVADSNDAEFPFWSPDSKSVAFEAGGKLKRVDLAGGAATVLCEAQNLRGGSWSEDGVILFSGQQSGLRRVPASGGSPTEVTQLDKAGGETAHYFPQFLPGGKEFLYLLRSAQSEKTGTFLGGLDGRKPVRVHQGDYQALYDAATGRLLYEQGNGSVVAKKMELGPPRLTGDAVVVAQSVRVLRVTRTLGITVAANGTLIYSPEAQPEKQRLTWRDRSGKVLEAVGPVLEEPGSTSLSPDGSRVAYSAVSTAGLTVWTMDLARGVNLQVTFTGDARSPVWSADGKRLYYYRNSRGSYRRASDGAGEEEVVVAKSGAFPQGEAPDRKHFLYHQTGPDGGFIVLPLEGERKGIGYVPAKVAGAQAAFSPDGRWIAYVATESGRNEIYIQGFPDRRGKWMISTAGGTHPVWRADGKELFWTSPGNLLTAASIDLQDASVRPGRAEALFRLTRPQVSPARDGKRFLVLEPEGPPAPDRPLVVMQNWAARLGK